MHKAIFALLQNPTLFFLNLAGASEGLIIAGFAAFLPKQIENQFSVTAISAALIMGLITVPGNYTIQLCFVYQNLKNVVCVSLAGGGGTFFGGYLVKKFNLACSGIIKMCLISTAIATCFTVCFFISCPNMHFAGITGPYRTQVEAYETNTIRPPQNYAKQFHLESECNSMCKCSRSQYDPVCGVVFEYSRGKSLKKLLFDYPKLLLWLSIYFLDYFHSYKNQMTFTRNLSLDIKTHILSNENWQSSRLLLHSITSRLLFDFYPII